jgi:hypothetical protein
MQLPIPSRSFRLFLSKCFSMLVGSIMWAHLAAAQVPTNANSTGEVEPDLSKAAPTTMTECEGVNNCATWTFLGSQGNGKWPSGAEASLIVENPDPDNIVIRRADSSGPTAGLTVRYTGRRHGDHIGGEFTSSWPGHWTNESGNWYATVEHLPEGLPSVMRFCGPAHCGTLTWAHDGYDPTFDDEKQHKPGVTTFRVIVFKPEAVLINRVESDGRTAVLTGKMSQQGNSVVDGQITFKDKNGGFHTFGYQLTWGSALNEARMSAQPQQQPTQPIVVTRPALVCFPWFFGIVCD